MASSRTISSCSIPRGSSIVSSLARPASPTTRVQNKVVCSGFLGRRVILERKTSATCRGDSFSGRSRIQWSKTTRMVLESEDATDAFDEVDVNFVTASVIEAVEVQSNQAEFVVKLIDGRVIKCSHNNGSGTRIPEYQSQPAIVLKLQDSSNILFPIIVLEFPRAMVVEALRNTPIYQSRPTVYQVIHNMVELMGYQIKMVRVTHREHEAYYARVYLEKAGSSFEDPIVSLDLRPSDAINIALRAKVPIQVHRALAENDGVKALGEPMKPSPTPAKLKGPQPQQQQQQQRVVRARGAFRYIQTEADRPGADPCIAAEEFSLLKLMEEAAAQERYADAAKIRDELMKFRVSRSKSEQQLEA